MPPDVTQSEVDKLTSYITGAWVAGSQLRVALYNGDITYSDYATRRLMTAEDALKTAARYAQDTDEETDTHNLEDVEVALEPFAAML
jgi:predicted metal-dependent hydrolase